MPESRDESNKYIVVSDQPATKDSLGFTPYVIAIAEFLTSPDTKPPLTLSIEGEWGSGKSSFMKQLDQEIKRKSQELQEEALKNIEKNELKSENGGNKELPYFFPSYFFYVECLKLKFKLKQNTQTIEFNAWRHDKAESLWAAFALSFLEQISTNHSASDFLPNLLGNLKLFRHRFNWKEKPFKAIQTLAITSLIGSIIVAIPFVLLNVVKTSDGFQEWSEQVVCILNEDSTEESKEDDGNDLEQSDQQTSNKCSENQFLTLFIRGLLIIGGTGGGVAGIGKLLATLRDFIGNPKMDLTQYLESPDYDKQVAFIEKFHDDFSKIVDAYVGKDEKVYVFIDDLDRCELGKSADLLQALNLMISNDPNIIFILGMDREKVAAGITFKQKDVLPYLDSISGYNQELEKENYQLMKKLDYGFNFMEKFIQLTFSVPKPSEKTLDIFLKKLSSVEEQETLTQDTSPKRKPEEPSIYPLIEKDLTQSDLENLIKMVALFLDYNPRRLKQYINVLKLRIYITYYSIGVTFNDRNSLTIEQLGKFVAITLKYPRLLLRLEDDNELLGKLEKYACSQSSSSNNSHSSQNDLPFNNRRTENEKNVEYWINKDPQLKNLLCYEATEERYSLVENKGIKKLLEVSSELELDHRYFKLRDFLENKEWKEADEETFRVIFDENRLPKISCEDLRNINNLWQRYSGDKFGFTFQKEIYFGIYTNCQSLFDKEKEESGLGYITSGPPLPSSYYPFGERFRRDGSVWELGLNKLAKRLGECGIFEYFTYSTEDLGNGVELEMVAIPGGEFMMGSPEGEGLDNERPQHNVTVQPFALGKYPITQAQYQQVMRKNPSSFKGGDRPVECVSWGDAEEFCQRLSKQTGKEYRLPSEAEWEYACRARTTTAYYFGDTITKELANYEGSETTAVGQFSPNAFGLYDMHGNVWEWCEDNWHDNYEGAPNDGRAWVSGKGSIKVFRGGSWRLPPYDSCSVCRGSYRRDDRNYNVGFRVVCVAPRTT